MTLIKKLIKFYFPFAIMCVSLQGLSQTSNFDSIPSAKSIVAKTNNTIIPPKLNYGILIVTQFSTSSYASGISTFISPHLTYSLNKRLSLSGGISIINTSMNGQFYGPLSNGESSFSGNYTTSLVYLSGQYLMNDRVTLTGTAYKQFNMTGNLPGYKGYLKNDLQGFYMNVRYKIMKNVEFEAGFGYSQGSYPFNSYPNYNSPFPQPALNPFFSPNH